MTVTLCVAIAIVCFRMLQETQGKPKLAEGQIAILAGSIALFGILVTAVFVITAFRIDENTERVATDIAETARERADSILEAEIARHNLSMDSMMDTVRTAVQQALQRSIRSETGINIETDSLEIGTSQRADAGRKR